MGRAYLITGLMLFALSVVLGSVALQLRYFTSIGPGPGFFPLWLCILLGLLSIGIIAQATFGRPEPMAHDFFATRVGYAQIAAIVVVLLATAAVIQVVGFNLTLCGFYLVLFWVLGRRSPIETVVLALLGSFGVGYVFSRMLRQPLPAGLLGI